MRFGILVVIAAIVVLVVVTVIRRRPVGAIAEHGRQLVAGVPPTPDAIALLERWADRAAGWRWRLALPTVLGTIVVSVAFRGTLDVGIGGGPDGHPAWADPLLTGLLSVFLGAIAAELHHLRRRSAGPRVADLAPRDVAAHLPPRSRQRLVTLSSLALVATGLAAVTLPASVPVLGLLAMAVAASVPAVQRGIVVRARPALSEDLRLADDAVRRLAVHSVDHAGAGAVLLLTAWQLAPIYNGLEVSGPAWVLLIVSQIAALVVALVWWRRSSPRRLLPDVPAALGAPSNGSAATDTAHVPGVPG